jgi:hypothetical protein
MNRVSYAVIKKGKNPDGKGQAVTIALSLPHEQVRRDEGDGKHDHVVRGDCVILEQPEGNDRDRVKLVFSQDVEHELQLRHDGEHGN